MPKVSVIIPVYGVEKYIERCARSLFEQTLEDIEFIFVNDCTPDTSIEVLERVIKEYPKREGQMHIVHHEKNGGLPVARQTGLKYAHGEYIAHCDSDDWVDLNLYETMYEKAQQDDADVVMCNCYDTDGEQNLTERIEKEIYDVSDCINQMMHVRKWWSLCNKLIRRDCYASDILYPKDGMGEDMCLTLQLMLSCKNVAYTPSVHYYYYTNPKSIARTMTKESCVSKFEQICRNVKLIREYYHAHGVDNKYGKGLNYLEFKTRYHLLPLLEDKKYYRMWKYTYPKSDWGVLYDNEANIPERIISLLTIMFLYPFPRSKYSHLINK